MIKWLLLWMDIISDHTSLWNKSVRLWKVEYRVAHLVTECSLLTSKEKCKLLILKFNSYSMSTKGCPWPDGTPCTCDCVIRSCPTPGPRPIARLPATLFPQNFGGLWRRSMAKSSPNFIGIRQSTKKWWPQTCQQSLFCLQISQHYGRLLTYP